MSLAQSKAAITQILSDHENKVVALSGKWGTGKSHLWRDIKSTSTDPQIQQAVYVSLFGVSSVSELKLKVAQAVIPSLKDDQTLSDRIRLGLKGAEKVLTGC